MLPEVNGRGEAERRVCDGCALERVHRMGRLTRCRSVSKSPHIPIPPAAKVARTGGGDGGAGGDTGGAGGKGGAGGGGGAAGGGNGLEQQKYAEVLA